MKLSKKQLDDRDRLTSFCAELPEVERSSGKQHTVFTVGGKKFVYHLVDHHGDGRVALQCKAPPGMNRALVDADAKRFFLPPYMAHHGWVGLYIDRGRIDWNEIRDLVTDAYVLAAPKRLAATVRR